jgi:cadmium resistance protein CadD (predicted permease)
MAEITISVVFALIPLIMSIVIAFGKGDDLIAGYNTASKEEKDKVNIKRLRLATVTMLLLSSIFVAFLPFASQMLQYVMIAVLVFLVVIFIIIANTWCKKK